MTSYLLKNRVFAIFPAESAQISPQCIIYGQMNEKLGCTDSRRDRVRTSWPREAFLGSSRHDFSCFMSQNFFWPADRRDYVNKVWVTYTALKANGRSHASRSKLPQPMLMSRSAEIAWSTPRSKLPKPAPKFQSVFSHPVGNQSLQKWHGIVGLGKGFRSIYIFYLSVAYLFSYRRFRKMRKISYPVVQTG